ncbi:MAG: hypothetical protein Wins2KO_04150 [Winogradskyella sp.]
MFITLEEKNRNQNITENFTVGEILDVSKPNQGRTSVDMDYNVFLVAQYIRDNVGPLIPSSAFRNLYYNRTIPSKDTSQHVKGKALDLHNPVVANWLHAQIKNNSNHYKQLRNLGLGGVGLYDWGVHIDTRTSSRLGFWDFRKKKAETVTFTSILLLIFISVGYRLFKRNAKK